jgi:hypothetical protein
MSFFVGNELRGERRCGTDCLVVVWMTLEASLGSAGGSSSIFREDCLSTVRTTEIDLINPPIAAKAAPTIEKA